MVPVRRQRSEQYLTLSQFRAHFRLHENGLWQTGHSFEGKSDFCFWRAIRVCLQSFGLGQVACGLTLGENV